MNISMYLVNYSHELCRTLKKMTISTISRYIDGVQIQIQIHILKVLEIIFQMGGHSFF